MKHVEIAELVTAVPIPMTRNEKLRHWASLVRKHPVDLALYHRLEFYTLRDLRDTIVTCTDRSAFGLAVSDPTFQREGLKAQSNLMEIMSFFTLSQSQLHEFSCDCGGRIDNSVMADRIASLT